MLEWTKGNDCIYSGPYVIMHRFMFCKAVHALIGMSADLTHWTTLGKSKAACERHTKEASKP